MVCVPCIVIPVLLWIFHKFIQPFLAKYFGYGSIPALSDADKLSETYMQIQNDIKENPVVIYEKASDKKNDSAKNFLTELGVSYNVLDIEKRSNATELQNMLAKIAQKKEIPLIFIGAQCVGTIENLSTLMTERKLEQMLKDAGAHTKKIN